MSEWVKVEERLPENRQEVIAYAPRFFPPVFAVQYFNTGRVSDDGRLLGLDPEFQWCDGAFDTPAVGEEITHWMPMPEPPA